MSALAHGLGDAFWQHNEPSSPPPNNNLQGLTNWDRPEIPRKAPQRQSAIIFEIAEARALFQQGQDRIARDIQELRASYVFADEAVDQFLTDHRALPGILREAIQPLRTSFGTDRVFRLEVSIEEDDSKTLYGIALWRDGVLEAAQALDHFTETWWLDHMTTHTADLAFTYELA